MLIYDNYLFSDLIILYIETQKDEILDVIYKRLISCNIDKMTASNIIESEIEILKRRKLRKNFNIKNKFWWLDDTNLSCLKRFNQLLTLEKNEYFLFCNDYISNNALLISEIISIFDEAKFIKAINIDLNEELKNEIYSIAIQNNEKSWLLGEIYSRFNYLYHCANKNEDFDKLYEKEIIEKFINVELRILFNIKWKTIFDFPNAEIY